MRKAHFLDEVGERLQKTQIKLFVILQEQELERFGAVGLAAINPSESPTLTVAERILIQEAPKKTEVFCPDPMARRLWKACIVLP